MRSLQSSRSGSKSDVVTTIETESEAVTLIDRSDRSSTSSDMSSRRQRGKMNKAKWEDDIAGISVLTLLFRDCSH